MKGFAEPVRAWRLRGLRARAGRPRAVRRAGAAELGQFRAALAACRAGGRGQAVHVRGEAGIGKTRLVEEFQAGGARGRLRLPRRAGPRLRRPAPGGTRSAPSSAACSGSRRAGGAGEAASPAACGRWRRPGRRRGRGVPERPARAAAAAGAARPLRRHGQRRPRRRAGGGPWRGWSSGRARPGRASSWSRTSTGRTGRRWRTWPGSPPPSSGARRSWSRPRGSRATRSARRGGPEAAGVPPLTIDLGPLDPEEARVARGAVPRRERGDGRALRRARGRQPALPGAAPPPRRGGPRRPPCRARCRASSRRGSTGSTRRTRPRSRPPRCSASGSTWRRCATSSAGPTAASSGSSSTRWSAPRARASSSPTRSSATRSTTALLKSRRRELHRRAADWYDGRDAVLRAEHLDRADDPGAPAAYLAAAQAQVADYRYELALRLAERGLELAGEPGRPLRPGLPAGPTSCTTSAGCRPPCPPTRMRWPRRRATRSGAGR